MGVIFDLDMTIVDSSIAKKLRDDRRWNDVYKKISEFKIYSDIEDIFNYLNEHKVDIMIVTSSPKYYCERVINYFKLPIKKENLICYHDTIKHKPDSEPIIKALEKMKSIKFILSFGDDPKDIIASQTHGILSVACLWGSLNQDNLIASNPTYICKTTKDAYNLIKENISKL